MISSAKLQSDTDKLFTSIFSSSSQNRYFSTAKMKNKFVSHFIQPCFQKLQIRLRAWIAKKPGTALTLVILSSVLVLPLVTSAALTPFVIILNLSNYLTTKGIVFVVYMIIFQVMALAALLAVLFFIAFGFGTLLSLIHSYRLLYK